MTSDLLEENQELRKQVADLEKENAELKTKKIPQLERRIASIRGSHSVDAKKLNARTEQVERLKKEVLEVRQHLDLTEREWAKDMSKMIHYKTQSTKAKEIIRSLYFIIQGRIDYKGNIPLEDEMYRANQFLNSEVEK